MSPAAEIGTPSPLFESQTARLRSSARLGPLVDLASGRGRHALAAAELGLATVAIDRNAEFLRTLQSAANERGLAVETVLADLETGHGIPLVSRCCGAVLVFRFLHRPLAPHISRLLIPGGVLLYETFLRSQIELGHGPKRPDFLLEPGELPSLFPELEVLAYDEGVRAGPKPEATARLAARMPA